MPSALKRIIPWIKYVVIFVVLVLVAQQLYKSWGQLLEYDWNKVHLDWFVYAGVFFILAFFPATIVLWYNRRQMGQKPALYASIRAYYISQLGKYTPGKAMVVIMRSDIIRDKNVRGSFAAAAVFFETFTMMAVGAFMSAVIMLIYFAEHEELAKYMMLNIVMLIFACLPTVPVVFRLFAKKLGVGKGDPELDEKLKRINFKTIAVGWALMAVGWVFFGLSLWATVKGIGVDPGPFASHFPKFIAIMGMSVVLGFVLMVPGGIGAREFVLMKFLTPIFLAALLTTSESVGISEGAKEIKLAAGLAVITAAAQRVVSIIAELAIAAIFYLIKPKKQ